MLAIIRNNKAFILPWLGALGFGFFALFFNEKLHLHTTITSLNSKWADVFFMFITKLGEFWAIVPVLLALLFYKLRYFLLVALSLLTGSLVAQFFKRVVFSDLKRPFAFKSSLTEVRWIENLELHINHSFPSGHTTAAMCMFFALAIIIPQKRYKTVLFILLFLVGYSRIYLSQHFLQDVLAGSSLGFVIVLVMAYLFLGKWKNSTWLDKPIYKLRQRN